MTAGTVVHALSIAGSDPSGGAGVQADLKTFAALGAYGMCALTALTAQNTTAVRAVHPVPADFLGAQIDAVFDDVRVDAVKIGMIGSAASVATVAACLERWRPPYVVLDPVMVAKSGDRLVDDAAVAALRERLLPLATVVTPNLPEAAVLLGEAEAGDVEAMHGVAERLHGLGPGAVLVKGGHLDAPEAVDVLHDGARLHVLRAPHVATRNTHGTGCTLSSAIAALAPRAASLPQAVAAAKRYLGACLEWADALPVGHGHGPVHHFHALWRDDPAAGWLAESR